MAPPTPSTTSTESRLRGPGEPEELSARRLLIHFALVLAVVSALGALLGGRPVAVSASLGVVLCGVNLMLMRRIIRALTEGGSAVWALVLPFKLLALVAAAFLLVHTGAALAFPLAIGFAVLPLTSVFLPRPSSVRGRA